MKRTKKKNPLNKRVPRELKQDIGKYLALLLFLTLTIGCFRLLVAGGMKGAYNDSFEKYTVEDGHFTLATELPELQEELEAEDVRIYPLWYKDFELSDTSSVRIYKPRMAVDRICLMKGSMPETNDEIVIDRLYAENNEIAIGDEMRLDDKIFTVSGVVAFSDYSALFKNNTDMMFNASTFTVACVTDAAFNRLTDAHIKYTYAWVNDDRSLSDAAASDKGDELKDILAKSVLLTDFVKAGNNQAIIFTGDDIGGDQVMVITMLYIVMAILAFIFGVTTRNTIEREAGTIGTLRASGYSRGELVRHYMILRRFRSRYFRRCSAMCSAATLFKGMSGRHVLSQLFTADLRDPVEFPCRCFDDRHSVHHRHGRDPLGALRDNEIAAAAVPASRAFGSQSEKSHAAAAFQLYDTLSPEGHQAKSDGLSNLIPGRADGQLSAVLRLDAEPNFGSFKGGARF